MSGRSGAPTDEVDVEAAGAGKRCARRGLEPRAPLARGDGKPPTRRDPDCEPRDGLDVGVSLLAGAAELQLSLSLSLAIVAFTSSSAACCSKSLPRFAAAGEALPATSQQPLSTGMSSWP